MPSFFRGNYTIEENFEKYKRHLSERYNKTLLYDFYMNYFVAQQQDKKRFIQMHPLIVKNIFKLSNEFILAKNSKNEDTKNVQSIKNSELNIDFDTILYKGLFPLDVSGKNYLYLKLLKFHFGIMQFFDLYSKFHFDKLLIDDVLMNDYLNKKFMVCLNTKKGELKNKADELNDFQLISNVCVRERLILYNFLNEEMNLKKSDIKRYINNQYINVFRNKSSNKETIEVKKIVIDFDFGKDVKKIHIEDIITPYSKI